MMHSNSNKGKQRLGFSPLNSTDNLPVETVVESADLRYRGEGGQQPVSRIPGTFRIFRELLTTFSRSISLKDL